MIDFNPQKITFENIDRFYIKRSIFRFLESKKSVLTGKFLDVGCGEKPYESMILSNSKVSSYSGIDLIGGHEYKVGVKPDFFWDGITFPFDDSVYDSAMATEVLEHCPDPLLTLTEIHRILKKDSPLILTVPFIWPTHEAPYDFYRYTPFGLRHLLTKAGFQDIEITCLGGWDASLAQVLGLWLKRRKMSKVYQKLLFFIIRPVIQYLLKKDRILNESNEQNLITNIGVVGWKK
ncbi:methyltransferase domain-containing protein [Algoriphagus sp. D3-2-R+10]|uniref:class I SAM-dependent methyltransferase n=1 Tax=Algoriphagus aurantiacus TaxID=3103948 RepID=UPI002B3C0799|nr:methyltransferase domain-containing protein [Algoriphagus sp. D3-2-R+10]MEB2778319.1 methyltransferase domain-containing protein [Algoriphagus sp. D3-2-R+10]